MPRLIYAGIELSYCLSRVTQEPVWDESHTDVLYRKTTISVDSILTLGRAPVRSGESLASAQRRIQHALETPRRNLVFEYNGEKMIQQDGLDAANGPMPEQVVMTKLSEHSLKLTFTVTTCQVNCPEMQSDGVLSNRWTESVSMDDTGRTTERRRRGRIVVASNLVNNPDRLRALALPPLLNGFRRIKSHYALKEDNTTIDYEVVDQESWLQPPAPAMRAAGTYRETAINNTTRMAEVHVELTGATDCNKLDLMATAIEVCVGKIIGRQNEPDKTVDTWVASSVLEEEMYEPVVRVSMRAQIKPKKRRLNKVSTGDLSSFSPDTVLSSTRVAPNVTNDQALDRLKGTADRLPGAQHKPFGTANIGLFAAALRDPCGQSASLSAPIVVTLGAGSDQGPQPVPIVGVGELNTNTTTVTLTSGGTLSLDVIPDEEWEDFTWNLTVDDDAEYEDPDQGTYDVWVCRKQFFQERFECVYPPRREGQAAEVVTTAYPVNYCLVVGKAIKTGHPPKIPDPEPPAYSGWRLIGNPQIDILDPELMPDGVTKKHEREWRYLYVVPLPKDAKMIPAIPPWLKKFKEGGFVGMVPTDAKILFPDGTTGATTMKDMFKQDGIPPAGSNATGSTTTPMGPGGNQSQV